MRYFPAPRLLCSLLLLGTLLQGGSVGALNYRTGATITPRAADEGDKPVVIYVDTSLIENLSIAREVRRKISQLPYVSKEPAVEGKWQARIRPDALDASRIVVEREAGAIIATIPITDPDLVARVSSALEREARWRMIRSLENNSRNSTIRIEIRLVQVLVSKAAPSGAVEEVRDLPAKPNGPTQTDKHLSGGDLFTFEMRNIGTADAFVNILDLTPDGSIQQLFPNSALGATDNRIMADGVWHRLPPNYLFRSIPPYGLETFKLIATKEPVDANAFVGREGAIRGNANPFGRLLEGQSVSDAKPFGTSDWGTASLTFQVGPTGGTAAVAITETDAPKSTLHILSVGIDHYPKNYGSNYDLKLAVKDARDFAAALEKVGRSRFGKINTKLVLDREATRASITAAFNDIIHEAAPQDTFVFFYAGLNRTTVAKGATPSQLWLLPTDTKLYTIPSDYELAERGISAALLQSWFTKIQSSHQLIVLDTDHSERGFDTFVAHLDEENRLLEGLLQRDMVILANAAGSYELLKKGNGALTYTLLQGLAVAVDEQKEITAKKLLHYAEDIAAKEFGAPERLKISNLPLLRTPGPAPNQMTNFKIKSYEVGADFPLGDASGIQPATQGSINGRQAGFVNASLRDSFATPYFAKTESAAPSNGLNAFFDHTRSRADSATYLIERQQEPSPKRATIVGLPGPQRSTALAARKGKDYALLIAINDYERWPHLDNPVTDAEAIADELKNFYGFETEVLKNPTKQEIVNALLKYKRDKTYADDDQLFIFFAGHGSFSEEFKEGYIIAKDSQAQDLMGDTYLSHSILRKVIDYIPCKHIFLVLDACFSGTFDEKIARRGGDPEYDDVTNPEFIERKMKFETRRFITSGDKVYVPDGRPGQHSPFARKLLEALRGYGGKQGILTITGVLSYVERVTPEPRQGEWGANEPGSDFVFIAKKPETKKP
ncbi:MAG: peptidase caspase catalytic subunit p20 [Acidobacteria bacterium]|nr:peptidase caspase catalytic subunit p20 [Acidobacteriota bacterium]